MFVSVFDQVCGRCMVVVNDISSGCLVWVSSVAELLCACLCLCAGGDWGGWVGSGWALLSGKKLHSRRH